VKKYGISLVAVLLLGIVASSIPNAHATMFNCAAFIDGPQANAGAGTGSPDTGTYTGTYDDNTNQLSWNIPWTGLATAETSMHFHGPALPNQNAGVQVPVPGLVSPSIGNAILAQAQEPNLLGGLFYLNLHSVAFPGGEIRGQVSCIPDQNVGGTLIPIDTAMILLAGTQSAAAWMIPVIVAGIGFAIVIARKL